MCRDCYVLKDILRDVNALKGDNPEFLSEEESWDDIVEEAGVDRWDIIDKLEEGKELFTAVDEAINELDPWEELFEEDDFFTDEEFSEMNDEGIEWSDCDIDDMWACMDDFPDSEESSWEDVIGTDPCDVYEDHCHVFGVYFGGISEACRFFGIDENLVRYGISNGLTLDTVVLRVLKITESGYSLDC